MKEHIRGTEHILLDGTHITSYSQMDMAQVGYNNKRSYNPQINPVYAFWIRPEVMPVYYRALYVAAQTATQKNTVKCNSAYPLA